MGSFTTQSEPGRSALVYLKQLIVDGFNSVILANNTFFFSITEKYTATNNKNQTKLSSIFLFLTEK